MKLSELFRPRDVILFEPGDKWDAIEELTAHAVRVGRLPESELEPAREAVYARARSMSTGMAHGVAIPHAAIDGVDELGSVLGIVKKDGGLAFESLDGSPAEIVVLLVIPRKQKILHIRTLADVARGLGSKMVRDELRQAPDAQAAWQVLARG